MIGGGSNEHRHGKKNGLESVLEYCSDVLNTVVCIIDGMKSEETIHSADCLT